jgi:hypothetical protein
MLFTTPTQWAALALVLVAGWLLGLASAPGGRRWRERYTAERDAHAAARRDADARVRQAEARTAELEREHARLVRAAPVTAATVGTRPVATTAASPAYPAGQRRGWFDWGRPRTY